MLGLKQNKITKVVGIITQAKTKATNMTVKKPKTMQLGLTYVIFKGDSQNTVEAVHNNPNSSFCETQSLAMDIQSMLSNFV